MINKLIEDLTQKLIEDKSIDISDVDVETFYEANMQQQFKKQDTCKFDRIYINYDYSNANNAKLMLENVIKRLDKGDVFEDIEKTINKNSQGKIMTETIAIDQKTNMKYFKRIEKELLEVKKLKIGQVSGIIYELGNNFCIIKLLEYKDNGYYSLKDSISLCRYFLIPDKYTKYIDEKVKHAHVEINKTALKKIGNKS